MIHRTLLVTQFFPPPVGGAEQYLKNLARGLPPERLFVVAPPNEGMERFDRSQPYRIIRKNLLKHRLIWPGWLGHIPWIIRTVRQNRITRIVFGHYAAFVGIGLLIKIILGTPYVVTVFGLDFFAYRRTLLRRLALRLNLKSAEWVATISTFVVASLRDFGVASGKILLAPPGLALVSPPSEKFIAEFRQRHQLAGQPILLTVARLVKRKGHQRVLKALPTVLQSIPNLLYVCVGDGPMRAALAKTVQDLNLHKNVKFLGYLTDQEAKTAYYSADVFIMLPKSSTSDAEGFGIVYLEALAAGVPIIATNSGGVKDIIRHEINGIALTENAGTDEIAQAIISLFNNPELRRRLGVAGRQMVIKQFTLERQVAPYKRVLQPPPVAQSDPPTVSVVMPVWNASDTLAHTLNSIALQTWQDLEVVVVDDGSTEDIAAICRRFKVQYIRQEHAGAPAARNRGFRQAQGKYVLFCDADVTLHPRMLERLVTTLDLKPEAAYAYCSFRFGWRTFDLFDFDPARLKRQNYISNMSLMRRQAFPGYDESISRLQDWDLWLTMLERGHRGVWVPARLFSAPINKHGISSDNKVPPAEAVQRVKDKHGLA